jgi:surface polysaccharide O-acyltransferase-like enzyme
MEILLFTAVAIAIYVASDWILQFIEAQRGKTLKQRRAVFFVVFLTLAVTSFEVLQRILENQ